MKKTIDHGYIKQIVADRLRATAGPTSMVVEEVNIREGDKTLARADIVMYSNVLGPKITIIEIKVYANQVIKTGRKSQIDRRILEKMQVYGEYANEAYLCLPKRECSNEVCSLCEQENIGLIAVNIDMYDGPIGILDIRTRPTHTPVPKKWVDLYLRLEKYGMPPLYFYQE